MTLRAEPDLLRFHEEAPDELTPRLKLTAADLATLIEMSLDWPPSTELIVMLKDRVADSLSLKCYDELWIQGRKISKNPMSMPALIYDALGQIIASDRKKLNWRASMKSIHG